MVSPSLQSLLYNICVYLVSVICRFEVLQCELSYVYVCVFAYDKTETEIKRHTQTEARATKNVLQIADNYEGNSHHWLCCCRMNNCFVDIRFRQEKTIINNRKTVAKYLLSTVCVCVCGARFACCVLYMPTTLRMFKCKCSVCHQPNVSNLINVNSIDWVKMYPSYGIYTIIARVFETIATNMQAVLTQQKSSLFCLFVSFCLLVVHIAVQNVV